MAEQDRMLTALRDIRQYAGRRINSITAQRLLGAEEALKWTRGESSTLPAAVLGAQKKIREAHMSERKGAQCTCPVCQRPLA